MSAASAMRLPVPNGTRREMRAEGKTMVLFISQIAPSFRELHAEVEVFSRLPAGRKTVGADITGSGKADAGANGVKGVR